MGADIRERTLAAALTDDIPLAERIASSLYAARQDGWREGAQAASAELKRWAQQIWPDEDRSTPEPMSADEVTALDPGIRDVVLMLREHGFNTTDSGDGVSKPEECIDIPMPHIAASTERAYLFADADRMSQLLPGWQIEATYLPVDKCCILLATQPTQEKQL